MATISIIATVLNEQQAIDRLVESLLTQSLRPAEVVIVDGGSTDGTWEKLQAHSKAAPILRVIRDESCNLKHSRGPIARGRNVAIAAAQGDVIACCDAGCTYGPEWLSRLVAPISRGENYVLGGSCIDLKEATAWDLAAAPLMGIALSSEGVRKSCTARSMAFTKAIWEGVGGFPEETLLGEDTVFDQRVQKLTRPAYAESAMAMYAPRFTFSSAVNTLARYSAADGALGVRQERFVRMGLRCLAMVASLALLAVSWWPLLTILGFELVIAFERDRTVLKPMHWRGLLARLLFSISVPWVSFYNYLRGGLTKSNLPNEQNLQS